MLPTYERAFVGILEERFCSRDVLIQVLIGPRQVGKTTGVKQLLQRWNGPFFYANADGLLVSDRNWLVEQWQKALASGDGTGAWMQSPGEWGGEKISLLQASLREF